MAHKFSSISPDRTVPVAHTKPPSNPTPEDFETLSDTNVTLIPLGVIISTLPLARRHPERGPIEKPLNVCKVVVPCSLDSLRGALLYRSPIQFESLSTLEHWRATMKKNITMKGKHYNHDNDLLFMPNGPTTEPNRTELGRWVRAVSKFNPFSQQPGSVPSVWFRLQS